MKVKVCGMRNVNNIKDISQLPIDIIGLIFYHKSARFVGNDFSLEIVNAIPHNIGKAGVFVNESIEYVLQKSTQYNLQFLQIHGNESPQYCKDLQNQTESKIIKAFQIDSTFDFSTLQAYQSVCDYFLFDTKSDNYGGTGLKFNWEILANYTFDKPFFLSGGIQFDDVEVIKQLQHPQLFCLDINSKFELAPALKNVELISNFLSNFK